jgi:hypothetical protein
LRNIRLTTIKATAVADQSSTTDDNGNVGGDASLRT